jgi:N-acetylmuramoyl-L-alanine amidase
MRQNTKITGLRDILAGAFMATAITMPAALCAQPVPAEDEWVVVIDAGHGGKDPGAIGSRTKEKTINLAVALKTGRYINENLKDVKVIYTRDDDTFPGLAERAEVANKVKADLFISIHSNSVPDKRFYGAETYVLGQTMDEANLQVAMKENSVITFESDYQTKYEGFDPNSAESYIIFSLMQNTYLKQSTEFATLIQNQFRDRVGRKDRGVKQAGLVVLWRTTMPSVLVELGFISNPDEEKYLMSEQGQDYLASAIFRAFRDYKQAIDSRSGVRNGNSISTSGTASLKQSGNSPGKTPAETGDAVQSKTEVARKTPVSDSAPALTSVPPAVPEKKADDQASATGKDGAPAPLSSRNGDQPAKPGQVTAADAGEIIFMVQIAAMPLNRKMDQNQLRGIETVTLIEDGERIKYAAGKYVIYDDAIRYRRTLTGRFPDAFVIAVRNGKIMPLREAIEAKKRKQ